MVSLRVDSDSVLDVRVSEPMAAPADLVKDSEPKAPPHDRAKRYRSRDNETNQSRKKYHTEMESKRTDLLFYEEARQMRARELSVGASSSRFANVERSTIDGKKNDVGTTNGVPIS